VNKPAVGEVGRPVPQLEAQEKVCGSAKYIADLYSPNMLYGAVLQSPHAHARILNYDLSQALAISGVRAIVTGDDLQDAWRMGAFIKDEHALAKGKVRYMGSPSLRLPPIPKLSPARPPPRLSSPMMNCRPHSRQSKRCRRAPQSFTNRWPTT